jgi:hypothetical protein
MLTLTATVSSFAPPVTFPQHMQLAVLLVVIVRAD